MEKFIYTVWVDDENGNVVVKGKAKTELEAEALIPKLTIAAEKIVAIKKSEGVQ